MGVDREWTKRVRNISLFFLLLRKYKSTFHVESQSFSFRFLLLLLLSLVLLSSNRRNNQHFFSSSLLEKICVNSSGTFFGRVPIV